MKRFLFVLSLIALMLVCIGVASAEAVIASGNCGATSNDRVTWTLTDDGVLTISGSGRMHDFWFSDYDRAPWRTYASHIDSVSITSGVTSIGHYCFDSCNKIAEIFISDSVTSIGNYCFRNCTSLTNIIIPDSVISIGSSCFYGCSSLTSVTIPDSVILIGSSCFYGCSSLTSVTIPDSITSIGDYCFSNCTSLTNITIPDSITSIGSSCFELCSSLTSITIPDSITSIGSSCFAFCTSLSSITIPNSVASIGDYCFYCCSLLKNIYYNGTLDQAIVFYTSHISKFPSKPVLRTTDGNLPFISSCGANLICTLTDDGKLNLIGTGDLPKVTYTYSVPWYDYRSNITSVEFPEGITSIGENCFIECDQINHVVFNGTSAQLQTLMPAISFGNNALLRADWICTDKTVNTADMLRVSGECGKMLSWTLMMDGTLTVTGTGAIDYFSTEAGNWSDYKKYVTSVDILSGVTDIGNHFEGMTSIISISLPNTITKIATCCFKGCSSLLSIDLPNSITRIANDSFYNCAKLQSVTIPDSVTSIGMSCFYGCSSLKSVVIPNSVKSISDGLFMNCSALESVILPSSISQLAPYFFYGCKSLTRLHIPELVTSIGSYCFSGCTNLTSIVLPDTLTLLPERGFSGSTALKNIRIPNFVTTIKDSCFAYCSALSSITLPSSVKSIGSNSFLGCRNLYDVYYAGTEVQRDRISFADSTSDIQTADWHYEYDPAQYAFRLPTGLSTISTEAFANVDAHRIVIPATVETIDSRAFANCANLCELVFEGNPAAIGADVLADCASVVIYVSAGGSAERWANTTGFTVVTQ